MTPIPAEIKNEARAFCDANPPSEESIARLIMAERERAARIARRKIVGGYMHGAPEWPDGDEIATAILSDKEQSR